MTTTPVHTITDKQIAEIEKSAKDKKAEGFLLTHNLSCDSLIALVARLREAEKDAARYRWLRDRGDAYQWENILGFDLDDFMMEDDALDHAIDVYMQEHTK